MSERNSRGKFKRGGLKTSGVDNVETSVSPPASGASKNSPPHAAKGTPRAPGGGRPTIEASKLKRGHGIAIDSFPEAMEAVRQRALGGQYPARCPGCGQEFEVAVPGDKDMLKLLVERAGGKAGAPSGKEADPDVLSNSRLVRYAQQVQDYLEALRNVNLRPLERSVSSVPPKPSEIEESHI
jgi:hypothetical protein